MVCLLLQILDGAAAPHWVSKLARYLGDRHSDMHSSHRLALVHSNEVRSEKRRCDNRRRDQRERYYAANSPGSDRQSSSPLAG